MKRLLATGLAVLALSACAELEAEWTAFSHAFHPEMRQVEVNGRRWAVTRPDDDRPAFWRASRTDDLAPFGKPGQPRAAEAVRVIEEATGCRVLPDTMYQDTAADFYAEIRCG